LTATFASPPPKVATNCGVCRKRSNPGGLRRSMISPKQTVFMVAGLRSQVSGTGRRDALDERAGVGGNHVEAVVGDRLGIEQRAADTHCAGASANPLTGI